MAVPSSRHKSNATRWNSINKQREEESKRQAEEFEAKFKKEVSEEEHEKRMDKLKELGLIK